MYACEGLRVCAYKVRACTRMCACEQKYACASEGAHERVHVSMSICVCMQAWAWVHAHKCGCVVHVSAGEARQTAGI